MDTTDRYYFVIVVIFIPAAGCGSPVIISCYGPTTNPSSRNTLTEKYRGAGKNLIFSDCHGQ